MKKFVNFIDCLFKFKKYLSEKCDCKINNILNFLLT